ncbi:sulfurtransferase [Asticcacaulis solisilvae]|uniref:sulfurtransferase n=1 Tax=Asticcacaulis solisilvae TaxID=1217274 RepID=UPI003FD6FCA0
MTTQIEPRDLNRLIEAGAVKVVDGSWALDGTDMRALHAKEHIPGAVFFDIDAISDKSVPLPHMAPSPDAFADAVGKMGISRTDPVVIYDRQGLFSAARVWWTFRLMGHDKVQVLKGGLPAWKDAGLPVTDALPTVVGTTYAPQFHSDMVMDLNGLKAGLQSAVVLDARPAARFYGQTPEPRAGLRSGHMPGAQSLPAAALIRDGALKPASELREIFDGRGVGAGNLVVTTCGSGVTAAIISMALEETGHTRTKLYDGSWAEWGQAALDTPVVA